MFSRWPLTSSRDWILCNNFDFILDTPAKVPIDGRQEIEPIELAGAALFVVVAMAHSITATRLPR